MATSTLTQLLNYDVKSKNELNKVVKVCGKVVGERQEHFNQLCDRRVVQKACWGVL